VECPEAVKGEGEKVEKMAGRESMPFLEWPSNFSEPDAGGGVSGCQGE